MTKKIKYNLFTAGIIIVVLLFKLGLLNTTFFWDSIACLSKPALFFYDTNLSTIIYSGIYDNGDPHLIPFLLASFWTLLGKSILVSHFIFLPVVAGTVYQILKFSKNISLTDKNTDPFIFFLFTSLIILSDPSVFTQIILLGIDLWVIFFGVYTLNKIITNQKVPLSLAFLGLCMTNRRGMIIAAVLMIAYVLKIFILDKKKLSIESFFTTVIPTLPACLFVLSFILFRLLYHGWVFSSPDSAWAGTSGLVNNYEFIRNCAIFIWRNIDFGRISLWIMLGIILWKFGFKSLFIKETHFLWLCYILLQIAFICVTIPLTNPFGARYFLIQFILLGAIVAKLTFIWFSQKQAKYISTGLIMVLITGNFWLYPEKIAQNWDCTLKHLPFYSLREKCFDFMEKENIPYDESAAGFCLYGDQKFIDLKEGNRIIKSEIDEKTNFFLYSNISNVEDELINELHSSWKKIEEFEKNGIFIQLLKKNKIDNP
jgi:hypothetical protein